MKNNFSLLGARPASWRVRCLNWSSALLLFSQRSAKPANPARSIARKLAIVGLALVALVAGPSSSWAQRTVLFPYTHVWKYNTTCLDGTGWEQPGYNDSSWLSGPGGFTGGETSATLLPFLTTQSLPAPAAASQTPAGHAMYFRTHFNVASTTGLSLILSNGVDDCAVFFLNGVKVGALPNTFSPAACADFGPGARDPNTDALLWEVITLTPSQLAGIIQPGDNVLAVEVHQVNGTSSDMVFICSVAGEFAFPPTIVTQPADATVVQCRSLTLQVVATGTDPLSYQWFKDGAPIPGATAATYSVASMTAADAGVYRVIISNPLGTAPSRNAIVTYVADTQGPRVVSVTGGPQGTNVVVTFDEPIDPNSVDAFSILIDGVSVQSATVSSPTTVVLVPANLLAPCVRHMVLVAEVVDACAGNVIAPNPAVVAFFLPLIVLPIDDTHQWKYDESGTDLGTAWRAPAYDDSAWLSGPALLGFETTPAGLPEPIRTPLTVGTNKPTFYFRTHFTLPTDPPSVTRLRLRQVLDDGAVYWLNGVEVFRSRIAAGPVDFNTIAVNPPVDPAQYEGPFDLPLAALVGGDNVLAVEVHQSSLTSSDVILGTELTADVTQCRPPTPPPVIIDFTPHEGGEGTILTVNGSGFHGGQPDDHCLVLKSGARFIDIEVLTATPTQLVARVGVIPPAYQGSPLQLMLGVGEGGRIDICPDFHDVATTADNWRWGGIAANATTAPGTFFAIAGFQPAALPPPGNFHSGPPAGGALTVTINRDWGIGSRFCISARVHAQGTGNDTRLTGITFNGAGSRFNCALRICDLLVKAFATPPPGMNPLNITCTVTTNGTNAVITIRLANGANIDGGNLDIIQKAPPPIIAGLWDFQNAGLWRKEIRKHEIARWYRCYEWVTADSIWFERRAEGLWITRDALNSFTCSSHCIYRFPNGRIWIIWRTFTRNDVVRFRAHYRFWWPGRLNPLLPVTDPRANRTMMSMDDLQIVLPMTPADPNPSTPFNEAVMIIDENGVQHFQGQPGFEIPPDIAGNPNGFQIATTAESTDQLPPAADRIRDLPMQPMPGMANLQPGVIIQWLVDKNGNVLVDHNNDGWPDRLTDPHVLGGQKHQGLIAPPTGTAGNVLPVDQGNNQLQLFCWELDPNGEVRGASPGQIVIGPPVDVDGDGVADGPIGGPVPADPTVRQLVVGGGQVQEQRDPTAKAVDLAVVEEAAPTDAQLAAMNANLSAQIPGFVPLQRPFVLCISRIWMRRLWTIDRRYVFDTWFHHWTWQHRNHIVLTHQACRVWLTKVSLSQFSYAQHCFPFGLPPTWRMLSLTDVRFFRVCFRVVVVGPNQIAIKIDQMYATLPQDPANPNSPLMLLSTRGDENALFQEVPAPVLAGLQPDPLPVGPDGVFIEPIDPVAGTLDIGIGGTGVFDNRPLEARGMLPAVLGGNADAATAPANNQLQLYCWALNPNGTIAQETFTTGGFAPAAVQPITLAVTPTPAMPSFEDDQGNTMDNPTMFITTLTGADNKVNIVRNGGTATLSWKGEGQLQSADQLLGNGPPTVWTDVANGALSPVTVQANQIKRFYRVRR